MENDQCFIDSWRLESRDKKMKKIRKFSTGGGF